MSDGLIISGGGSTAVASDELFHHSQSLARLSAELALVVARLGIIDGVVTGRQLRLADAPLSAQQAEQSIRRARELLADAEVKAGTLSAALIRSAEAYGLAERIGERLAQELSARLGYAVGFLLPLIVLVALPALSVVAAGVVLGAWATPGGPSHTAARFVEWLRRNNGLLADPATVALVRASAMSSDDFLGGVGGLPPAVVGMLGDEGLGVTGVNSAAGVLALIGGSVGLLHETSVKTSATGSAPIQKAPQGFAERMARMPEPAARKDGAQIRVERYSQSGTADRFEVYIAGTVDFSLTAGTEPWDMTSNVHGVAGLPAGSLQAVTAALAEAGVTPDSPIQFNGYSQGGLVASHLAASGHYNTQGLFTVGSPAGQVSLPSGFPIVVVEHSDDIVPATGGNQVNLHALVIERQAFAHRPLPDDFAVPAHQIAEYQETARLLDGARSAAVKDAIEKLDGFAAGATTITETTYRAERVG